MHLDELCLLHEFVSKDQSKEDRNVNVRRYKGLSTEVAWPKAVEPVEERYNDAETDAEVREERLQWCLPVERGSGDIVVLQTFGEADVLYSR